MGLRVGFNVNPPSKTAYRKRSQKLSKKRRKYGSEVTRCAHCGTHRALMRKFGLDICRRSFRELYAQMGFQKI